MGKVIGITGRMGSGKSHMAAAFADFFSSQGCSVDLLSVDNIRRYILMGSPAHQALRDRVSARFGVALEACGALPLADLSSAVFLSDEGPARLQEMIGQEIARVIASRIAGAKDCVVLEWARLIEDGYLGMIDSVVVVHCDTSELQKRLSGCGLSPEVVARRLSLQMASQEAEKALAARGVPFRIFDATPCPDQSVYQSFCAEVAHA